MPKPYTFFLFFVGLCFSFFGKTFAHPLDSLQVASAAQQFMHKHTDSPPELRFIYKSTDAQKKALFYVFGLKKMPGYVIISADDAAYPILGYSTHTVFAPENLPVQLDKMLWHSAKEIEHIRAQALLPTEEIRRRWQDLQQPAVSLSPKPTNLRTQAVAPLVKTKWNQAPYYNDYCPYDTQKKKRTVTGCVATAMAQLMKYHNHPETGQGIGKYTHEKYGQLVGNFVSTTYKWNKMPNELKQNYSDVARLMYHCGISVEMNYGTESSGARGTPMVANALAKYFKYDKETLKMARRSDFSESEWVKLLKHELDNRRPIYYQGSGGGGGHAFVCDGYDANNYFHFNWGWGGLADGYYYINALNPQALGTGGGLGAYNSRQSAVLGIKPIKKNNNTPRPEIQIKLYSKLTVKTNPVKFGGDLEVSFNLWNTGSKKFEGDYAVCLYNAEDKFVSFVGDIRKNWTLPPGKVYINPLNFKLENVFLPGGKYAVFAYYRPTGGEWTLVSNNAENNYYNYAPVDIEKVSAPLIMYKVPITVSSNPIFQNQPFEVKFNIATKDEPFEGKLSLGLYNLDGTFAAEIGTKIDISLDKNQYYTNPHKFKTAGINVPVGTYLLAPAYNKKNTKGYYVLEPYKDEKGTYPNLIRVVVAAPPLTADKYEPNNSENQSYRLPLTFRNGKAAVSTTNANIHTASDLDHYTLDLPPGYNYRIWAQLQDKDHSTTQKKYSLDAVFSYKISGSKSFSTPFDISIGERNDSLSFANGGAITFRVAPYFSGYKGTYRLDIHLERQENFKPELHISAPAANDRWQAGKTYQIRWRSNLSEKLRLEVLRADGHPLQTLAASVEPQGAFDWQIPENFKAGQYKIKLSGTKNPKITATSGIFTLTEAFKPELHISAPAANDRWQAGKTYQIRWRSNLSEKLRLEVLRADGHPLQTLAASVEPQGAFDWQIPENFKAGQYKIKLSGTKNPKIFTLSGIFTLTAKITALANNNFSQRIEIYPNPADNFVTVRLSENKPITQLRLLDLNGRELLRKLPGRTTHIFQLNLSEYPQGNYYMYLESGAEVGVKKLLLKR